MKIQKSFENTQPTFYIIPTPIGNLDDITFRTIKILKELDILYCEDTRITKKLLNHLEISLSLETYNDQQDNANKIENIIQKLKIGQKIGLVSDAGMPVISDPGFKLIKNLKRSNINIVILPGASAFLLPQVFSTKGEKEFLFYGFLSKKKLKLKEEIITITNEKYPTILYETPHSLLKTLKEFYNINSKLELLVARELTKIHEEYIEGTISELIDHFESIKIRGEFILIVYPSSKRADTKLDQSILEELKEEKEKGYSEKDAIKIVSMKYAIPKNELYKFVLENKEE